jgi:hypothetical protein
MKPTLLHPQQQDVKSKQSIGLGRAERVNLVHIGDCVWGSPELRGGEERAWVYYRSDFRVSRSRRRIDCVGLECHWSRGVDS